MCHLQADLMLSAGDNLNCQPAQQCLFARLFKGKSSCHLSMGHSFYSYASILEGQFYVLQLLLHNQCWLPVLLHLRSMHAESLFESSWKFLMLTKQLAQLEKVSCGKLGPTVMQL